MSRDPKGYLSAKCAIEDIRLAQLWTEIDELYKKRLWHQLTVYLITFVKDESFKSGGLLELYNNFIADFEHKINPLSLVEILCIVGDEITDTDEAIEFFERVEEKVKNDLEASVLCMIVTGVLKLKCSQLDDVKELIENAGEILDKLGGVTSVHARYYELCSNYYKLKANHGAYYRDALRYLGCVDIAEMPEEEKVERAFSLSIAALLGDGVYNFGELLAHSVLDSLNRSNKAWIVNLLYAFNAGKIAEFEVLQNYWEQQPDLLANQDKLLKKIRLLCLMELVFSRHAHDRTISFATIAEAAHVDMTEVEHLVMKCLSLGLVKGTIDEVNKEVDMKWVQPRVLDRKQIDNMRGKVEDWHKHIKDIVNIVGDEVPELVSHSFI